MERLKTATAEATMNAMEHGNGYDPNLPVDITIFTSAARVEVHVADRGQGSPVSSVEDPDLDAKLAGDQSPRGWGIFLIKNMVDDLRVVEADGKHRLELIVDRNQES
jgi:anti-sigma regulatory factor (Ser/Thr protein kinase)